MSTKYNKIIVVVVLIVLAFFGYEYFRDQSASNDSILVQGKDSVSILGQDIERILANVSKIDISRDRIDRDIFDNAVFDKLRDQSQTIPEEPVGRNNPFADFEYTNQATVPSGGNSSSN